MPASAGDITYFLALARSGRLVRAAELLQVDHTTVSRRIRALEQDLGWRLFDRSQSGWVLTEAGHSILPQAELLQMNLDGIHETLGSTGTTVSGRVRVATIEGFGAYFLAPRISQFAVDHPNLVIEIAISTDRFQSVTRDFDVAVTLDAPTSDRIRVTKLSDYELGFYATGEYLSTHDVIKDEHDLSNHSTIWYVDSLLVVEPLQQLRSTIPKAAQIQSTSISAQYQAALAGVGVALLPRFMAAGSPLEPVLTELKFKRTYWLVVPREHERLPRVRTVVDLLTSLVGESQSVLNGLT